MHWAVTHSARELTGALRRQERTMPPRSALYPLRGASGSAGCRCAGAGRAGEQAGEELPARSRLETWPR